MIVSPIRVCCPHCGLTFSIELVKAQAEIDRLEAANRTLRDAVYGIRGGEHDGAFDAIFGTIFGGK